MSADAGAPRGARLGLLAVLLLAALWACVRALVALHDPAFDTVDARGLLKSDPALLVHLVQRIVDAGGAVPAGFGADGLIEHPAQVDLWSRFPPAHLYLIAWVQLALDSLPLHVTCVWVSAAAASLMLVGVWLLALELSGSTGLALLAALLAAATPAALRTLGFVLVDEDFAWPLFALHLGLAARALRVRTPWSVALAALALAGALASWHAMAFFAALEALAWLAWLALSGRSPLALRGAWLAPAILLAIALAVPSLRASGATLGLPVAAAAGLWLAGRARTPGAARALGFGATAAIALAGVLLARTGAEPAAHAHVFALLAAKLAHLGVKPADGSELDPIVRLMWQGPFETLDLWTAIVQLSLAGALGLAAAGLAAARLAPGQREAPPFVLAILFALSLAAAWLASRAVVLPALLAPALAAWAAARVRRGPALLAAAALAQLALGAVWLARYENPWYYAPRVRQAEIRWLVEAVERHVPPGEAVAADFMSSSAILLHTGRPIVFGPKWEAAEPRRRAAELLEFFHHRTSEELRRLLVERYRVRWLVVDRFTLGYLARWSAGLPPGSFESKPGTAAAALLSQDDATLRAPAGFELVARSPATIRQSNGAPSDFYRLYRLAP